MLITTTPILQDKKVEYIGVIAKEVLLGINIGRDILAGIRNIIGGRSKTFEKAIDSGRNQVIQDLTELATSKGANGIIGLQFDYEFFQGMLMVVATGTAVIIKD